MIEDIKELFGIVTKEELKQEYLKLYHTLCEFWGTVDVFASGAKDFAKCIDDEKYRGCADIIEMYCNHILKESKKVHTVIESSREVRSRLE